MSIKNRIYKAVKALSGEELSESAPTPVSRDPQWTKVEKSSTVLEHSTDAWRERENADQIAQVALTGYSAMTNDVWVFACVQAIARSAASVPFKLYRKGVGRDGNEERDEIEDPAAVKLLANPSPDVSWSDFVEHTFIFLEVAGNAYWEPVVENGALTEIYNVPGHRVRPIPDPITRIKYWEFLTINGHWQRIDKDALKQIRYPNPQSDFVGLPTYVAAMRPTMRDAFAQKWIEDFFRNGAIPLGTLETDKRMSDPDVRRVRKQFKLIHNNVDGAHEVAVLSDGMKYKANQMLPDMAFVELRKMSRVEILAAHGVPSVVVGVLEDASYSNAEAQLKNFWRCTMLPKLKKFEDAFNMYLAQYFGPDVVGEFDRSAIDALKEDTKAEVDRNVQYVQNGILTINEVRSELNKPPVPWGDEWHPPTTVQPSNGPLPPAGGSGGPGVGGIDNSPVVNTPDTQLMMSMRHRGFIADAEKRYVYSTEKRDKVAATHARMVMSASNSLTGEVHQFLKQYVAKELKQRMGQPVIKGMLRKANDEDTLNLTKLLFKHGIRTTEQYARASAKELGSKFKMNDQVSETLFNDKMHHAQLILSTTCEILNKDIMAVADQVANKTEKIAIRKAIDDLQNSNSFSVNRAAGIAQSETNASANYGALAGYEEAGIDQFGWLAIGDRYTRDSHRKLNGTIVDAGKAFESAHGPIRYPGDPKADPAETVRCRCTTFPVVNRFTRKSTHPILEKSQQYIYSNIHERHTH